MDFYHFWGYTYILNTPWFMWSVTIFVFAVNFLSPVLIWLVMNSKPLPFSKRKQEKQMK